MSIVIIGGHDRMVAQYKEVCKGYLRQKCLHNKGPGFINKLAFRNVLVLFYRCYPIRW